jgi:hypothetical protein
MGKGFFYAQKLLSCLNKLFDYEIYLRFFLDPAHISWILSKTGSWGLGKVR